jgi:hypothetical protein
MRIVVFLCLMVCVASASGQQFAARVSVASPADVVELHRAGIVIDDARIKTRLAPDGTMHHNASYNTENGFVTVIGTGEGLDSLRRQGYTLDHIRELSADATPARSVDLDTIPYQFGWPRAIFNGNSLYENSPTVGDMDGNGQLDISITNAWGSYQPVNPPYLITWRRNGAYLAGFPSALEPGVLQSSADGGISAMGDIVGDAKLEIVCGDENGFLYAFNSGGTRLTGFPISYGFFIGVHTPALADIDGDGKAEIAVISHDWDSPYGNAFLHVLKVSTSGATELPGFPIGLERGAENSPAIGDLDGDGSREIVVATGGTSDLSAVAKVIAFSATGQVVAGFPWIVGRNTANNSPTLYDLDGDGTLEILIRVMPDNNVNGIYAIDHEGRTVAGFPFPITYGRAGACVAVGDMDGDEIPELAYGGVEAVDSGKVWVYNLNGTLLPGYPVRVYRTWVDGSVAIADVDGDGLGDVVCSTNGVSNKPGLIRAFNRLGQEIAGFPLSPGNPLLNSFETHPTVVDIDGDGDTEIFAGRLDKYVYGWDTPGLFDSTKAWTTFKGNAARTGGQVRGQIVSVQEPGEIPERLLLEQNYPNPFNPGTTITYRVRGQEWVRLIIYDVLGRDVATLVDGIQSPGRHDVVWDATAMAGGVYVARLQAGTEIQSRKLLLLK